jgi:hypothetical protein
MCRCRVANLQGGGGGGGGGGRFSSFMKGKQGGGRRRAQNEKLVMKRFELGGFNCKGGLANSRLLETGTQLYFHKFAAL